MSQRTLVHTQQGCCSSRGWAGHTKLSPAWLLFYSSVQSHCQLQFCCCPCATRLLLMGLGSRQIGTAAARMHLHYPPAACRCSCAAPGATALLSDSLPSTKLTLPRCSTAATVANTASRCSGGMPTLAMAVTVRCSSTTTGSNTIKLMGDVVLMHAAGSRPCLMSPQALSSYPHGCPGWLSCCCRHCKGYVRRMQPLLPPAAPADLVLLCVGVARDVKARALVEVVELLCWPQEPALPLLWTGTITQLQHTRKQHVTSPMSGVAAKHVLMR